MYEPLRDTKEIAEEILKLEKEIEGFLKKIFNNKGLRTN